MKSNQTMAFVGGGTAGHIYPLVAVAKQYKAIHPRTRLIYLGGENDKSWLPKGLFSSVYIVESGKWHRYLTPELLKQPGRVWRGWRRSLQILQNEEVMSVFCKGGHVSLPVALAAHWLDLPVYTHETDSHPGVANRIMASFAQQVFTAFPVECFRRTLPVKKCLEVGQPVREEFFSSHSQSENFDRSPAVVEYGKGTVALDSPYVLVTGGSQGAVRMNSIVSDLWPEILKTHRIIHITGEHDYGRMKHLSENLSIKERERLLLLPKVTENMAWLVRRADVVISRAGGTIWELLAARVRMVLIPLSTASGNHQYKNAKFFVQRGWATMAVETVEDPQEELRRAIKGLKKIKPALKIQNAARTIAELLP